MHGSSSTSIRYAFGPVLDGRGTVFRLWAPLVETVTLKLCEPERLIAMERHAEGWFEIRVEGVGAGTRYLFVLPDGTEVPDPASRFQPHGVLGPSVICAPEFGWTDGEWTGRRWEEAVIYELHVGTFTAEGTFRAAIDRLDALAALGVTAVEIMPLHAFPGDRGWGYDGVCLYAPHSAYGTPDDFKAFVDAAHARSLMVYLDVVYNHFGPEGNLMPRFMPLLSRRHEGEYGTPLNFDDDNSDPVRRFIIENALYWLETFHCDGLRLDAVHEIPDESETHLLAELSATVKERLGDGRQVHLILENSHNEVGWLDKAQTEVPYDAQWDDDIHHSLHVAVSGEKGGFYEKITEPFDMLTKALSEGFAFQQDEASGGKKPGEPSGHLPPTAFIAFVQNHDQIGNRPDGTRITHFLPPEQARAMATLVFLSPTIPMLFMGEEWAASTRFFYFSDLGENLRDPVRRSREEFLATWNMDVQAPDPFAVSTFERSRLDWSEMTQEPHAAWLDFYRGLIETRRREIVPRLVGIGGHAGKAERIGDTAIDARWRLADGSGLRLLANLGPDPHERNGLDAGRRIWATGNVQAQILGPWSVAVSLDD
ncbi:malto-oligosyltrehalose trehalohydrolase [Pelagibacterium sp. H642]|uniref:malto-oligosyltrehalose trehalohydrolase n=1 Tax=Pelagibacterium sp. H642 TaxID=1881069 RepID=UPI002814CF21|nr:malto-oligosyltrehalose trehalohydrolase [Pelagibacterium sp. H642]WMT91483.1 malto-oligosyltrehalose trehalohydrolase [Pelagibacterium sp. H642]